MKTLSVEQIAQYQSAVPEATEHEPLAKHTSFRVGGPARLYVVASSSDALIHAVQTAQDADMPWFVFGGGSNLLVSDQGFEGVVIQAANRSIAIDGKNLRIEGGAIISLAARQSVEAGLEGFEWAATLPGTIGGAIFGDAGCFGGEIRNNIMSVDAYRIADGERVHLSVEDCAFGYRDSLFKHEPHLILGCELRLAFAKDPVSLRKNLEKVLEERKMNQPFAFSSAGCVFKNFETKEDKDFAMFERGGRVVPEAMKKIGQVAAGWIIDRAGLKGLRIGQAMVSEKHANFIVNHGGATATDIYGLIQKVKQGVEQSFGVALHEEVQCLGF